jgi:ABC-type glycerol-3-phosphate transport system substrate-binding protein
MSYQLTSSETVKRLADNAFIPFDPANRDYQEYLAWLAEGNTPNPYTPPTPTWEQIRSQRDQLLKETDWVGLKDVVITNEQAWLDYRQALRDIPQNFTNPEDVVWPTKPE